MGVGNNIILRGDVRVGNWRGKYLEYFDFKFLPFNRTAGFGGNCRFLHCTDKNVTMSVSYKTIFKFILVYMFSILYVCNLTCRKHRNRYKCSKIINLIKKKKRIHRHSRIKFILLKTAIFSFLSFLNEVNHDFDTEIKSFYGNSKELFDSNYIFIS